MQPSWLLSDAGVAGAQCCLPPVSQRTRRHHWHLATRAAGSHDDLDAAHGLAAGTRGAREAGASRVSNTFHFMKTCTSYSTKTLHKSKSLQHNGRRPGPPRHTSPPGHSGNNHRPAPVGRTGTASRNRSGWRGDTAGHGDAALIAEILRLRESGMSLQAAIGQARAGEAVPLTVRIPADAPLRREWFMVCAAPDYPAFVSAWEFPGQPGVPDARRRVEVLWSVDAPRSRAPCRPASITSRALSRTGAAARLRRPASCHRLVQPDGGLPGQAGRPVTGPRAPATCRW